MGKADPFMNEPARFRATTPVLTVRSIPEVTRFYTCCLGFTLDFTYGNPPVYAWLFRDAVEIHLIEEMSPNARQPVGSGNLSILTSEVDDLCHQLANAGVEILVEPANRDYGLRDFSCKDPDGNIFNFGTEVR